MRRAGHAAELGTSIKRMERSRKTKRERFTTDDAKYFRRWADDVIAELKRAMRRREFFRHWAPKEDV